ncbi:hypothetical protein IJ135_02370, partial [Candidatus Saccharibacteria bacterium]|nr:hypothetical protein [Candidatus Saccharibacteria bacterium]
ATQSTISLSLSSNNIVLYLLQPGTHNTNNLESGIFGSASTTASVSTTNYTGYTLSIAASSSTNAGKLIDSTNTDTSKNYFSSIESATPESVFSNFSNTSYNGKWGYKPSYYNSAANTNYLPAPSTTGVTIEQTTAPNTTAKDYTITLGARANVNQSAGSYSNTFNIVATANPVTYSITYSDNSGDSSVSNLPSVQASSLNAQGKLSTSTISLSSTIPTRTGYTFNKWCLGTVSNSGTTCTGTEYNAGADFGIDQTSDNSNITLYATWTINKYTCTKRYRLQNADGSFPTSYTSDGTEQVNFGATCTYAKTITDYKPSTTANNSTEVSTSGTMTTSGITLSLDFYRDTYALTINRNSTYISSVSGAGTYRWGESASVSASLVNGAIFDRWTQTSGATITFADASNTNTSFIMPKNEVTIYADANLTKTYIQDYTLATCSSEAVDKEITVYDKRDDRPYTVRYINNACWMTRNLAFHGATGDAAGTMTLEPETSNVDTATTATYYDAITGGTGSGYSIHLPDETHDAEILSTYSKEEIGAFYNEERIYVYNSYYGETVYYYPLCPKGWSLDGGSYTDQSPYYPSSNVEAFSPVFAGLYDQNNTHVLSLQEQSLWSSYHSSRWSWSYNYFWYWGFDNNNAFFFSNIDTSDSTTAPHRHRNIRCARVA